RKRRDQYGFSFTKPYLTIDVVIIAQRGSAATLYLDDMADKRVGAVKPSAIYDHLVNKLASYPKKYAYTLVPVPDTPSGMEQVSEGELDALVTDGAVSGYYWNEKGDGLRVAGDINYAWNLCFAVTTNCPLPTQIIDKAMEKLISKKEILSRWPELKSYSKDKNTTIMKISGALLLITILVTGSVILWNRTLRKQITDHLRELGRVRQSHAQATHALGVSEERFRVLVESSNDIIWEMDRYGGYLYVSPRVRDILGYTPDELVGKSSLTLMVPEDAARKMEQLRNPSTGSTIDCEINTYLHKNGQPVILESSGMAFLDNTGELAGYRGISRDITERIANENALRLSEERFRNLVETTSDWIWEVNVNGCYTYASPQSSELLGYAPEDLIGKHFTSLMPNVEAKTMYAHFGRIVEKGNPMHSLVNTYIHRDGRNVMLETSAVPFYDKEWNIRGYRGIGRDITERVATERQLAFERNLFRTFMDHAPDLIYFKDADGRFIEINTAKAEQLRLPPDKIIGRTDYDFLPPEQAQQKFDDECEVMRTRKPMQKEEIATTPDGTRWYLTTKVPRYDEDGKVVGTFGTSWDITYRRQAEEELRQLRALLSNTIDSMPSILVGVDAEGRVIQWNRQAEYHTGLSPKEAVGLHLRNAFPALSREMVKVERAIRERAPQHEEHLRVELDNRTRYNDITVFPLLGGDTEGAVIRVDDVTDRVMIENSIRNIVEGVAAVGRRFFNSMVTQLGKTLDADFTYISEFVDEAHQTMRTIAVSDKGAIGSNFDYELAAAPCARVLDENGCLYVENVREQYPESEMFQSLEIEGYIGIPLVDSENKALGIMVAMYRKPIDQVEFASSIMQVFAGRTAAELERLQATKELIALQNLLENIIDSMPSILIGIDAEGRVMQWNREAEQVSGINAERAHGQPLQRVFPDFGSKMSRVLETFGIQGKQHHERINCVIKGESRIVDVTIYPITAAGAEGAVIRLDDVTDRVRIEEMMVQSEKMMSIGGLAAGMAHEINNPLAGILQNIQVVQNRIMHRTERNTEAAIEAGTTLDAIQAYMQSRDLIKMLDSTAEASRRAAKIVDNMLSFSR
ncbi:MAG TPA: PAS domain S-box protein, partial [Pontiella sp.]|nr:PAS domain S-box protein [Pontiella sp.]